MKNGIKIFAALLMAFAGISGTNTLVNHVAATTVIDCGCGKRLCDGRCRIAHRKSTCQACNTQCGSVACPQCECEVCCLEVENTKVKKTCFKVEQKTICIPPVRFPWNSCPPTTARTKTVNVLKKDSYECPKCTYQWTLQKSEVAQPAAETSTATTAETVTAAATAIPKSGPVTASLSDSSFLITGYDPSTKVQPTPPQPSRAFGPPTSNEQ